MNELLHFCLVSILAKGPSGASCPTQLTAVHLLQVKCDQYWPTRGTETYGLIQVTLLDTVELATYCVRTFALFKVGSASGRRHAAGSEADTHLFSTPRTAPARRGR